MRSKYKFYLFIFANQLITSFAGIFLLIRNNAKPHLRRSWPILELNHILNLHAFKYKKSK